MLLPEFPAFPASFVEKKRRKNRTDAPKYYVAGNHEPIISKKTFATVKQELVRRADMVANGRKNESIVASILSPGSCSAGAAETSFQEWSGIFTVGNRSSGGVPPECRTGPRPATAGP